MKITALCSYVGADSEVSSVGCLLRVCFPSAHAKQKFFLLSVDCHPSSKILVDDFHQVLVIHVA